jgi:hypothetical protein
MSITTWTTPRTWATDEMTNEDILNTHVRDNQKHLYEKTSLLFYSDTQAAEEEIATATYVTTSCTVEVTLAVDSDVIALASGRLWSEQDAGDTWNYTSFARIYRDSTGIGNIARTDATVAQEGNNQDPEIECFSLQAHDAALAAGTYTYAIFVSADFARGTVVDNLSLIVLVIPRHS